MACDSPSTKPSSSMVGTSPLGFILRYSGVLLTPNCIPASMRSYFRPSSSAAHSAFFTFTELVLPQIFSMVSPKSGTDHVSFLYRPAKNVVCPCFLFSKAYGLAVSTGIAGGKITAVELPDQLRAAELVVVIGHRNDLVAAAREAFQHRRRETRFDADFQALHDAVARPVARRLRILPVIGDAHHHLGVALRLHGAPHDTEAHHRLTVLRDEARDDRLVRALARADPIGVAARHHESRAPVLHRDAVYYHARAESHVVGLDERRHHAGGIGRREVDGAALGRRAVAEVLSALHIDERGARFEVAGLEQLLRPHVHVVEIAYVAARIGEGELHRLDLQMQAVGAVDLERGEIEVLHDAECDQSD